MYPLHERIYTHFHRQTFVSYVDRSSFSREYWAPRVATSVPQPCRGLTTSWRRPRGNVIHSVRSYMHRTLRSTVCISQRLCFGVTSIKMHPSQRVEGTQPPSIVVDSLLSTHTQQHALTRYPTLQNMNFYNCCALLFFFTEYHNTLYNDRLQKLIGDEDHVKKKMEKIPPPSPIN